MVDVLSLRSSVEDDRPFSIGRLPVGESPSWENECLIRGKRHDIDIWEPYELYCGEPGTTPATEWDYYSFEASSGIFSQRAIDVLTPALSSCFDFLPSTLEGQPYYFLHCRDPIDCLIRDSSRIEYFPAPYNDKIMHIDSYVFDMAKLSDSLIFTIPEQTVYLFATKSIVEIVRRAKLKGFTFEPT